MEEVLTFAGMNPKKKRGKGRKKRKKSYSKKNPGNPGNPGKKGRRRRKGKPDFFKKLLSKDTAMDFAGVSGGVIIADLGLRKASEGLGKLDPATGIKKPIVTPGTMIDALASFGVGAGAAYGVDRILKNPRLAVAVLHGGMAITTLKILGSGEPEPIGEKIAAGYGARLRSMFAGVGQDEEIIFLPEGGGVGEEALPEKDYEIEGDESLGQREEDYEAG
ncbi:hypothetical protein ES702_07408 [subsurface metagenome]